MPRLLGLAMASKHFRSGKFNSNKLSNNGNEIAWGTIGNASTSEGLFFETVNAIGVHQVPAVISIWDDDYGISVDNSYQTTKSSISEEVRSNESIKSVVDGLDLIAQSTMATFEKIGIKKIESINQKFDHNLHQAMMEIEKNDCEPGTIVQELIPGYTLHDRLLRPAMVGVSKKSQENQDYKAIKEEEKSEK